MEKVKKLLSGIDSGKAAGPDDIHPLVLSKTADVLALPVTILFRRSLDEGTVPNDWRSARVTPEFKKGSKLSVNNYRPVSLTCILCKIMEKLVRTNLIDHLQHNNLISDRQHGFVAGRSCTTQLLEVLDKWTKVLDEGGAIDAVYLDFQKAFDKVPHRRLLSKVEAYGIRGNILHWLESFLQGRNQRVVINGVQSEQAQVVSGIPQGSVLGHVLFMIYINDLPACVESDISLFADDAKVFTRSDAENATSVLQEDLD